MAGTRVGLIDVWTRDDYARDPSYIFPTQGKTVRDVGAFARITPDEPPTGEITVKLGGDAIEIDVVSSSVHRVNDKVLVALAKDAVSRTERRLRIAPTVGKATR